MTDNTLKCCPFCGGDKILVAQTIDQAAPNWFATCHRSTCGFVGYSMTKAEALTAWNTRTPSHHDLVEALRAMIEVARGYAEYISSVPSAELERHPYLPGLEGQINESRAILTKAEAGHG